MHRKKGSSLSFFFVFVGLTGSVIRSCRGEVGDGVIVSPTSPCAARLARIRRASIAAFDDWAGDETIAPAADQVRSSCFDQCPTRFEMIVRLEKLQQPSLHPTVTQLKSSLRGKKDQDVTL